MGETFGAMSLTTTITTARRRSCILLFLVLAIAGCVRPPPDLVLVNGRIYTFGRTDGSPVAQAIAIRDGRVIAVDDTVTIEDMAGSETTIIDLEGATALPGLTDAHAHLFNLGRSLSGADLRGAGSPAEVVERLAAFAEGLPDGGWLRGRGWDQNDWDPPVYPDRTLLDDAFGDRPVYLERIDGHAGWANTAALAAAGITADTPDPEGGEILRDPETGEPTGILIDAAEFLVTDKIPAPGPADLDRQLAAAAALAVSKGLTGVHEMGVTTDELAALQRAEASGTLPLRVVAYLAGEPALKAYRGEPLRPGPEALVRLEGVKYYADGALGSRGAALKQDYSDRPGHRGLLLQSHAQLALNVKAAVDRGFSVAVHAIGDEGNHVSLDAIQQGHGASRAEHGEVPRVSEAGHRIEHAQVVDPAEFGRFAELGVIPSVQPTHCTSDMPWAPDRLGPDRLAGAYAWREFLDRNLILPLGSDFPVEEVSPLFGLYAAVTRQTPDGHPPGGWSPRHRLTREEAILGFTRWPAEAIGVAEWGRLRPGDRADITVFDGNPLRIPAERLLDLKVRLVVVEGRVRSQ